MVSRLETSLSRFAEGRQINPDLVSEYLINQKPTIESVSDLILLARLIGSKTPGEPVVQYITSNMPPPDSMTTKHLSVLVSTLSDLEWVHPSALSTLLEELIGRPHSSCVRVVARLCKGVSKLESRDEALLAKVKALVDSIEVGDIHVEQLLQIAELAAKETSFVLSEQLNTHATMLVPFMSDAQAKRALKIFKTVNPESETVAEIKRHLVRAKPRRSKTLGDAGLESVPQAPYFGYVRKIDLR